MAAANLARPSGKRQRKDDLKIKSAQKKRNVSKNKDTIIKGFYCSLQQETKSDQEASLRKNTLFVDNLSRRTKIPNIIDFFKNVGEIVRVRLIVDNNSKSVGCGFVQFASANEAEKALQEKNGEYLHEHKIVLDVADKGDTDFPPKYCIDHKVWNKDYRQRVSLPIEDAETSPNFVEEVLFVVNLSPQTKMPDIFDFFNCVGEVVSVRLIVNQEAKHVGYAFVEFASAKEAKKALNEKNGEYLHDHKIFLDVAKTAPYPTRPKYILAGKLCYEDSLQRGSLLIKEDEKVEGLDETPDFVEAVALRKRTLFVAHLSRKTKLSHIINFFKDVGEVVQVRLIVNHEGKHVGCGFIEFASADEAKMALEKKNGEYLHKCKVFLEMVKMAPYPPPKYCIDHKDWYEDYLQRESLLREEDVVVAGLDKSLVLVEEVAVRKKTLFVANLQRKTKISHIIDFFKYVGEVVSVRLIVNDKGKRVGCAFVEFASADEANKALEQKHGGNLNHRKIFLNVSEMAPYPLRPKYNHAERIWYVRESILKKEKKKSKKVEFCGTKIVFSYDDEDGYG